MGQIHSPAPALFVLGAFSRHDAALDWTRREAEKTWGPVAIASPRFAFRETSYYESTMGPELKKCFFAIAAPFDPAEIVARKIATNAWEEAYVKLNSHDEARPLNLDPGYITLGKLVLASTKDHWHRMYLSDGIYAEVTLHFAQGNWIAHEWTFPDYRRADYHAYFTLCRDHLRALRRGEAS